MPESDRIEFWHLLHADGRRISIGRRPEHVGLSVIAWHELRGGEVIRKGSVDFGMFSMKKPAQEIAELLERFRGEGYELAEIRTALSPTVLRLLREIDALDDGSGVGSKQVRNGWILDGSKRAYSHHTFRALDGLGVIDVGNGNTDPAKILPIGRDLARMSRRRAKAGANRG